MVFSPLNDYCYLNTLIFIQDDLRTIFKHIEYVKIICHRRNCMSCRGLRDPPPFFFMADKLLGVRKFEFCILPCCCLLNLLGVSKTK